MVRRAVDSGGGAAPGPGEDPAIPLAPAPPQAPAPPDPDELLAWQSFARAAPVLAGALLGGLAAGFFSEADATPVESAGVAFALLLAGGLAGMGAPAWADLLPLMGRLARLRGPLLAGLLLVTANELLPLPAIGRLDCLAVTLVVVLTTALTRRLVGRLAPDRRLRVAVIGSSRSADSLGRELRVANTPRFEVVGRIAVEAGDEAGEVPTLGRLEDMARVVEEQRVALLLMTGEVPRLSVFNEIARSCLDLPVRLRELAGFYEEVFGHVPVAEINASWFQYIIHPSYRTAPTAVKRAMDLVLALAVSIPGLPLIGLLALLVRRDGGPAFFRQTRIGESGRPFTILKLRTMRVDAGSAWASADDARVTPIGRLLRRTHLDELPQLLNVLRGEMSIVGPRPEQPEFVEQLETTVPFYERRHLVKPGVTGWAQVRCGYAGSEIGSAWKVAHDLYYVKHRSTLLDLVIVIETARTLFADPQYSAEPSDVNFILAAARSPVATSDLLGG